MNIQGQRTMLRAIEPSDNLLLEEIINDPETEFMIGGWSFPISSHCQEEWFRSLKETRDTLRCMIVDNATEQAVGVIMLTKIDYKNGNGEIHIKMGKAQCRGQGFGTDALVALTAYAFKELRLHLIYARIIEHNIASRQLFEKCGYICDGVERQRIYKKGVYHDVRIYSIINEDCHG